MSTLLETLRSKSLDHRYIAERCTQESDHEGAEVYAAAAMLYERVAKRIEDLEAALKPFADVARHDIGADERDIDLYQPMSGKVAGACLLTVGDMRHACSVYFGGVR